MSTSTPQKVKDIQVKIQSSGLFQRIVRANPHPEIFSLVTGGQFAAAVEKLKEKAETEVLAAELEKLVNS